MEMEFDHFITKLVDETFQNVCEVEEDLFKEELDDNELDLLSGPGIAYKVNIGTGSYNIKGFATDDLKSLVLSIKNKEIFIDELINQKNSLSKNESNLYYHPVSSSLIGESILNKVSKYRVPIFEDRVFSISDPGYSWWLEKGQSYFKIHFRSQGLNQNNLIKLGPIGDGVELSNFFREYREFLTEVMDIKDLSFSRDQFFLEVYNEKNNYFCKFLDNLCFGRTMNSDELTPKDIDHPAFHYFDFIGELRAFWIEVGKKVEEILMDQKAH